MNKFSFESWILILRVAVEVEGNETYSNKTFLLCLREVLNPRVYYACYSRKSIKP